MTRYPAAYIRRSVADVGNPGDVSREIQESAVRALLADGHNGEVRLFVDWARSADEEKEARRTEFRAMLAEVEAGNIHTIAAYSLDRLYRSMGTFIRLTKAAREHDVRIVTKMQGVLGGDGSPMATAFAQITAVFAELELNTTKSRNRATAERRHARGDAWGYAPFGWLNERGDNGAIIRVPDPHRPVELVLDAYRTAGTVLGAARLLRERGIPAPRGGSLWSTFTVARIIEHNAPDMLPRRSATGRRQTPPKALLAGILRCHCEEAILTPNICRAGYYCWRGRDSGRVHGKYNVQAAALLDWVKAEAARLVLPETVGTEAVSRQAERDALEARKDAAGDNYAAGAWTRDKRDRVIAEANATLAKLDSQEAAVAILDVPAIDWDEDEPGDINVVLRTMWRYIELGPDLLPIRAEWYDPRLRADGDDDVA